MGHTHGHDAGPDRASPRVRAVLIGIIGVVVLSTLVGMVVLRPAGGADDVSDLLGSTDIIANGTVVSATDSACPGSEEEGVLCTTVRVRLTSGPDDGTTATFDHTEGPGAASLSVGDRIKVARAADLGPDDNVSSAYAFADFQRSTPLLFLALLFAAAVIVLGRFGGVRALVALGISLLALIAFVIPAILDGRNPVAVAIVGSSAVMLVALYLSHGFTMRTTSAALGTAASLIITGGLAVAFVAATRLTGLASEEATYLQVLSGEVNVKGLLLGGIIIGSLGVLDDVTVTQASAVWELHRANPSLGMGGLYRAAVRIGRDHIASTVNTLVLAYAGASLPLLVLLSQAGTGLGDALTSEVIAVEIVRTLVGSIGLVASVPITTALTAWIVTSGPSDPA